MNKEKIFIISGPSGAGEDSIIKGLKKHLQINSPITTTTRKMRATESEGNPYYFIDKEEFKARVEQGKFFEWTEQDNGNFYGVAYEELDRVREKDGVGILKIDYRGVITVKELLGDEAVSIFINCPVEQLAQRLYKRDNASEEFVNRRMEYAKGWFKNKDIFDFEILNDDGNLDQSIKAVQKIIEDNIKN